MLSLIIIILLFIQHFHPTEQLKTIQATLASTVELPCSIVNQTTESANAAKIVWIRDDQGDIVSLDTAITVRDDRLSILTIDSINNQERTLRIANIQEQDHGLYRCIQGDTTINEILLDVLLPPRIISHSPENMHMTVREGRSARFSCMATGHPTPTIIWDVNGLSRPGIVSTVDGRNESVLILRNISRFHSGRIDCSASNILSTVNRQFSLYVKYKPLVTVPFHSLHFRLNDSATITCQVCAVPSATILDFFRPKQPIPIMKGVREKYDEVINQTCTKLIITIDLNETSLFGPYVCRARNSAGVNHAEFVLKELIQSPKHIKHVTEHRPSSTLSTTPAMNVTIELINQKNQCSKFSISILFVISLFILMI